MGLGLGLALVLAAGQAVGIALHALSRNRRWHDRALFAGIGLGVAFSLAADPAAEPGRLRGPPARAPRSSSATCSRSCPSPGARAPPSTRAGARRSPSWAGRAPRRSPWRPRSASRWPSRSGCTAASWTSGKPPGAGRPGRACGSPASWAPSSRRTCASRGATRARRPSSSPGSIGPLVLLLVLWQGSAGPLRPGLLLAIASFSGLGALGANAFALERQGLGLLFGFPADRLAILVGKNLGVIALRLPALSRCRSPPSWSPGPASSPRSRPSCCSPRCSRRRPTTTSRSSFPFPVAAAGRDPSAPVSGTRGLGAAAMTLARDARDARRPRRRSSSSPGCPQLLGERWLFAADAAARARRRGGRLLHGHARAPRGCSSGASRSSSPAWRGRTEVARRPRVAIIGLGLVGGSLARALTAAGLPRDRHRLAARRPPGPAHAGDRGGRDARRGRGGGRRRGARGAAGHEPPPAAPAGEGGPAGAGASPTSRASRARSCARRRGWACAASSAATRWRARRSAASRASSAGLFQGAPWWIVPAREAARDAPRARAGARDAGARPITTDAATHDRAMAFLSHAPAGGRLGAPRGGPGRRGGRGGTCAAPAPASAA